MSKLTIGLLAGIALATGAALTPMGGTPGHQTPKDHAVNLNGVASPVPSIVLEHGAGSASASGTAGSRTVGAAATSSGQVTVSTSRPGAAVIRKVTISLPSSAPVGTNVTGFISVMDVSNGSSTPVPNVQVALQQKRAGTGAGNYLDLQTSTTDVAGRMAISFTSRVNTTWRAAYRPAKGPAVYSGAVTTAAPALVTWATRPVLTTPHGVSVTYSFRILPTTISSGHVEIAKSGGKTLTWVKAKDVKVGLYGIFSQAVKFPTAGTWMVRAASAKTASNASGYTSTLTVTVS